MKTLKLHPYYGMEYLTVILPLRPGKHGDVVSANAGKVERAVATLLIRKRVPLRGVEVKFLRKVVGLSFRAFADELGLTAPGVLKWEQAGKERLSRINEAVVRALIAEKLGLKISGQFSKLVGSEGKPGPIVLDRAG